MFPVPSSMPSMRWVGQKRWAKFPRVEAHFALTSGGSQGWVSDYDQFFKHVADINVRDLEDVFWFTIIRMVWNILRSVSRDTPCNIRCQLVTSLLVSMVMSTWLTIVGSLSY